MPAPPVLYLVRHARAEERHPAGDFARALTPKGRRAFQALAEKLAKKLALTSIVSSPLVRAVQTAELLAQACGVTRISIDAALMPGRDEGARVLRLIHASEPGAALVGHNPGLGEALSALSQGAAPTFKKGAVVALGVEANRWVYRWMQTPRGGKHRAT